MSLFTSLISHWKLDEASGTRVDAVVASGNDLTDNNTVTQVAGKIGNAAHFTQVPQRYLSRASNSSLQGGDIDLTVAAWINIDGAVSNITYFCVSKDNDAAGKREYFIAATGGATIAFQFTVFKAGDVGASAVWGSAITASTWYYVVGWHDATAQTVNISVNNGTPVSTSVGAALQAASTAEFEIGRTSYVGGPWNTIGAIDEVSIWKRVLTAAERTSLYNNGNGLPYPFVEAPPNMVSFAPYLSH